VSRQRAFDPRGSRACRQIARQQVLNAHLDGRPLRAHCHPADDRADRVLAEGAAGWG
jgi:hypothetical protein